jgi:hypothetical protein
MKPMHRIALPALLLLAAACTGGADARDASAPPAADSAHPAPAADTPGTAWRSNPAQGVTLIPGSPTVVETGPHTLLWQAGAPELAPPYTIRAELRKRTGRLHEGYGVVFGATGLEGGEDQQAYSYFLVRGDGSFLVKRRAGAETPVVRDWTRHPRITRDNGGEGRANLLEVNVGTDTTVFAVNGAEVARVPSVELAVQGRAGLRVAHEVAVEVRGFQAAASPVAP